MMKCSGGHLNQCYLDYSSATKLWNGYVYVLYIVLLIYKFVLPFSSSFLH